jgi:hypothetical protein
MRSGHLELEVSVLGTIYRRAHFLIQYVLAAIQWKAITELLPVVKKKFEHPWVVDVELRLRSWHGLERPRLWNSKRLVSRMHWDAPITISVFRRKKGKKREALCMSFYVIKENLYIKQIQGVSQTDVPRELAAWPKMFMEACQEFARQQAFNAVSVPRAVSLYSYHNPYISKSLLPDGRERASRRIRRDMELLYDKNALELGFVSDGDWLKWTNPELAASDDLVTSPKLV